MVKIVTCLSSIDAIDIFNPIINFRANRKGGLLEAQSTVKDLEHRWGNSGAVCPCISQVVHQLAQKVVGLAVLECSLELLAVPWVGSGFRSVEQARP